MLDALRQDTLHAFRNIRKQTGYALLVIFTLALAIGGSTTVFSVVNGILIRSLPYREPDSLVMIWNRYGKLNFDRAYVSPPDFLDRKRDSRTLASMAAIEETSVNLIGRGEPIRVRAARVSHSLLDTLKVSPIRGRNFTAEEDQPGKSGVVILSYNIWKRQFGGEESILGQTLNLSGSQYTVIGMMPKGFWFPAPEIDLWMPIAFTSEQTDDTFRGNEYLSMVARIKPGVAFESVEAEMSAIAANVLVKVPERREFLSSAGWGSVVVPFKESVVGEVEQALMVLMGAVTFLLLIACANVANLILARTGSREKEIAVRAVLGAGRKSLIRLLFVEALLLALVGGATGLFLSYGAVRALPTIAPENLPRMNEIVIDKTVMVYSLTITALTALLIGIVPALRVSIVRPFQSLKLEGTSTPPKSIHRFRNLLVIGEITLALVLAIGAGLLAKSFQRLISVDPGFQTENRVIFTLSLPASQYTEPERISQFYADLLQQVRALPGVRAAGANLTLPMQSHNQTATFVVEEKPPQPGEPLPAFEYRAITPEYFKAMGISFLSGRDFNERDIAGQPRVAIIDQKLANRYWKNQNPIGKRIGFSNANGIRWREVVGIVRHVKNSGLKEEGGEQIYFPHGQMAEPMMTIVLHVASGAKPGVLAAVRERVRSMDSNLPIYQTGPLSGVLSASIAQPRFHTLLFVFFAATALTLAAVGIYGVLSYSVTQRRKEIGIRIALGAQPQNVLLMIVRQSFAIALTGTLAGIIASLMLSRFLQSLLFQMKPVDPLIYAGTAAIALFIALFASSLPARRASRLDPLRTLRE